MKRLVFVNSAVRVQYIKEFMRLKGIEKYTLLQSSKEFREELLVNAADVYIFDFYLDASIIEALMDFYDNVNTLHVHAESIRVAKAYSRLTQDVFIIPDEVNFFIHFWEAGFCRLENALICESAGKPVLHVRRPEGLIIKTKRMRVDLTQSKVPTICMDSMGKQLKIKADQMQVTLRPAGLFAKPEVLVRKQPKLGSKLDQTAIPEYKPVPAPPPKPPKPVKPPKPPKPVKEKPVKPPKPVKEKPVKPPKPPKPLKEPKPVAEPVAPLPPELEPLTPPTPVTKPEKPLKPKWIKEPKMEPVEEVKEAKEVKETKEVEVNMTGAADKVAIADEFDNRLRLLDREGNVKKTEAQEVSLKDLQAALTSRGKVEEEPKKTETQEEPKEPEVQEEQPKVSEEPEVQEEPETQEEQPEISEEPKKKGLFGRKKEKKDKKKNKPSLVVSGMDWDLQPTEPMNTGGYSVKAFKAKIITKIDEYMVSNGYINQEVRDIIDAEFRARQAGESVEVRFGELAVEMGYIDNEQYCDIVAGFRNIEILHWKQLQKYQIVVDRFNANSYATEGFFETTPTEDGRVRVIASVNSDAIDTKIRKYAESCIILYTIDAYILQKLKELEE